MNDSEIRRRALHAAQVVTLGFAMTGCYTAHVEAPAPADPPVVASDAGTDAGSFCVDDGDWEEYQRCCEAASWSPEWGCNPWGPFVPPGVVA